MSQVDQKYDAVTEGSSNASAEWSVEELNIVDLDDRLELADRCSGNNAAPAE